MTNQFIPTEEQQKILDIKEGLHLVLAPPGSGKTELLANRVYCALNNGYNDSDIICLTFTNRAAKGMKERIEKKYPNNNIIIGNIHHFCSTFLLNNNLIPLNSVILDEEDSEQLIVELKDKLDYPPKTNRTKKFLNEESGLWQEVRVESRENVYTPNLIKLATYLQQKELGFPEELFIKPTKQEIPLPWQAKELCESYNKEKENNNYFDFDDLLTLTYHHLKSKNKKDLKLSQFKWIQIDEVQDLNPMQWAIINEIKTENSLVVYFGDYEQAIFSFMGAKLESLHEIETICKSNPKNGIHNLLKNFRSPSYLLDVYTTYAEAHFVHKWKKKPIPNIISETPSNSLRILNIDGDINHEAAFIAKKIIPFLSLNRNEVSAIIVRFNSTADLISKTLMEENIPHFKISGFDFFRRKSIKGMMAFFSVFLNEYDRMSWARLFYEFQISRTLKESRDFANELFKKGITPLDILKTDNKSSRLSEFSRIYSNQEIIVFDTETTGLDTTNDDIIQIAAIKLSNGIIKDVFEVYINTEKDISQSEKIHHISKEHLNAYGVTHEKGLSDFMDFIGEKAVLVAHNIKYDIDILKNNLLRNNNKQLENYCDKQFDSITIAKLIYPSLASYKLKDLLEFLNVEGVNSHNALDDVKATVALIEKLNSNYIENLQETQNVFLNDEENNKAFSKFISRFKPLYLEIENQLDSENSLKVVIESYFKTQYLNDEDKIELIKLLRHIDLFTVNDSKISLYNKIQKYIPEYKRFKESDLYLGAEKFLVSTVFKAKGLEFDNVIIAEAVDDIYPSLWALYYPSVEEEKMKIDEDARTFYVALTRAKKRIYITHSSHSPYGHTKNKSRFINPIEHFFNG